ncbi:MAG: MBL fold metallo-hydrolase [Phycisphaerae bacterium]|nr:MBL fold metallo-hydrolase [Phycisphaerae bacterium]
MNFRVNTHKIDDLTFIGYSVGGEETVVGVPELNVCFDIGRAPSEVINIDHVLLTHGHMDHAAGIAYYFSQRNFLDNSDGTIVVPKPLAQPIHRLMEAWVAIENHRTPYRVVGLDPGEEYTIRKNLIARAFRTEHAGPCLGYSVLDVRQKLKDEFAGTPGQELAALKQRGVEITYTIEVPLVCYCGDTAYGRFFELPCVRDARILVLECTFVEEDHRSRADAGYHLHVEDFVRALKELNNQHVLLTHLSHRTTLKAARQELRRRLTEEQFARVHFLMARPRPGNLPNPHEGNPT